MPPVYCRVLRKLQDDVAPRPVKQVWAALDRAYGAGGAAQLFSQFDADPVAAASLAHPAVLRDGGAAVAVKVQYLDVQARYQVDLSMILYAMRIAGWLFPAVDFSPFIKQCDSTLHKELDFVHEAENLKRSHADLLTEFPDQSVVCPKIYDHLTRRTVLVTEFIDGPRATDVAMLRALGLDPAEAAAHLLRSNCSRAAFATRTLMAGTSWCGHTRATRRGGAPSASFSTTD